MKTTIDNSLRVFMLTGDMNRQIFCNMQDIEKAFVDFDDPDSVQIYEFWNSKPSKVSIKKVVSYLQANQLPCKTIQLYAGGTKASAVELRALIGH